MANQISEIPDHPGNAGLDFNYAAWTAGTTVLLCNVPWNNDYRDIVKFNNQAALNNYLENNSGPTYRFDGISYAPVNQPIRVNLPFNQVFKYNYLRATNLAQPVPGGDTTRSFYYFITDVQYVSPNTTLISVQLDVWQSFEREITFGNSYVERGHIGIANSNQMNNNGRDYLTVPEGLDVGGEYRIVSTAKTVIANADPNVNSPLKPKPGVMVMSTVDLSESGGTVENPELKTASGSRLQGLPNGASLWYIESINNFMSMMNGLRNTPWISQGIISVYAIPALSSAQLSGVPTASVGGVTVREISNAPNFDPRRLFNQHAGFRDALPTGRYARLHKLKTYPYMSVELTTFSGNPLLLKPESMPGDSVQIVMLSSIVPPNPRIGFYPYRYNAGGTSPEYYPEGDPAGSLYSDNAEFLDMQTGIFNLPTFSVVNNSYMSFLASNSNSIAYQHRSADWSQQRALAGNDLSATQASMGISTASQLTSQGIAANTAMTALQNDVAVQRTVLGAGTTIAGGAAGGPAGLASGAASAAMSGLGTAIDINQRNQALGINSGLARQQNQTQNRNAAYNRDTNKDYADWAARGDYANQIAGINARVQDAQMIQPTTSGQMGGDAFNLSVYEWAIHSRVKFIQENALAMVGEYWLRYGYAIHRFMKMPSNYRCMAKFTYWKLRESYITSSTCPETYKQAIRGIFEKGVTVWVSPADIGNIDIADNTPLEGISY